MLERACDFERDRKRRARMSHNACTVLLGRMCGKKDQEIAYCCKGLERDFCKGDARGLYGMFMMLLQGSSGKIIGKTRMHGTVLGICVDKECGTRVEKV